MEPTDLGDPVNDMVFDPSRSYFKPKEDNPEPNSYARRSKLRDLRKTGRFAEDFSQSSNELTPAEEEARSEILKAILDGETGRVLTPEELAVFTASTKVAKAAERPAPGSLKEETVAPALVSALPDDTPLPTAATKIPKFQDHWDANFFDFRGNAMPRGCTLVGNAAFERQASGGTALSLDSGAYLHLDLSIGSMLPSKPSTNSVIFLEVMYPQLPTDAASLVVYNPALHEAASDRGPDGDVLVSGDGGVGALGRFGLGLLAILTGVSESAAVRPGEWARILIVKSTAYTGEGSLLTYINGKPAAQITEPPISTDRFNIIRNVVDIFRSSRPSLQRAVKIRVAAVFMCTHRNSSATQLIRILNKSPMTFSAHAFNQEVTEARLFSKMSLSSLFKRPPPLWLHPLFTTSLSESLLAYSSSQSADVLPSVFKAFNLVLRSTIIASSTTSLLDGFSTKERETLASVAHSFARATSLVKRYPSQERRTVAGVINYTKLVCETVLSARLGEANIIPLGVLVCPGNEQHGAEWETLPIFAILDRVSETHCTVTMINAAISSGLSFHPSSAADNGILRYQLALPFENVPMSRASDPAFWSAMVALILPIAQKPFGLEKTLYGKLLPTLTGEPLATTVDAAVAGAAAGDQDLCPLPLTAGSSSALCHETVRYLLRRAGFTRAQTQLATLALHARMLELAHSDVTCYPRLSDMDARVMLAAASTVADELAQCSSAGLIGAATLAEASASLDGFCNGVKQIRASYHNVVPPQVSLDDGGRSLNETQHALYPLFDRLVRLEGVDGLAGAADKTAESVPLDLMCLPARAKTMEEIEQAIVRAHAQMIVAHDSGCVRNTALVIFAITEHLVTRVLPVPVGIHSNDAEALAACPWQASLLYTQQARMVSVMSRIAMFYSYHMLTVRDDRVRDYSRLVVIAGIGAIVDSLMRRRTEGFQSSVSLALLEGRFAPSLNTFAVQTATALGSYPELQIVRDQVIRYFNDIAGLSTIFPFNTSFFAPADLDFIKACHSRINMPTDRTSLVKGLLPSHNFESPALESYPELHGYRDIFVLLAILHRGPDPNSNNNDNPYVPEINGLPSPISMNSYDQRSWNIYFANSSVSLTRPHTVRFPPGASLEVITKSASIKTEDDILHVPSLPDCNGALGQADAETLYSYLTVPYLRIPLVLGFFSTEERISALRSPKLCEVLEAVLFEPGRHTPLTRITGLSVQKTLPNGSLSRPRDANDTVDETTAAAVEKRAIENMAMVPVTENTVISTRYGHLLTELCFAPGNVLKSVVTLVELALGIDIGTVQSSSVPIILFVFRIATRIENYASFVHRQVQIADARSGRGPAVPEEWVEVPGTAPATEEHRAALETGLRRLRALLWGKVHRTIEKWGAELFEIIRSTGEDTGSSDASDSSIFPDSQEETKKNSDDDPGVPRYFNASNDIKVDDLDSMFTNLSSGERLTGAEKQAKELAEDQSAVKKLSIDAAVRLLCVLHAHTVLLFRNVNSTTLATNPAYGASLLSGTLFLTTRHTFGTDKLIVPEHLVFEALSTVRRTLVEWLRSLSGRALGLVMESVIRVVTCEGVVDMRLVADKVETPAEDEATPAITDASAAPTGGALVPASTLRRTSSLKRMVSADSSSDPSATAIAHMTTLLGSLDPNATAHRRWYHVPGPACLGSFVSVDVVLHGADVSPALSDDEPAHLARWEQVKQGMVVDTQTWQLTLKGSQLQALPPEVQNEPDVNDVCGSRSMQAALIEVSKHRKVYRIVGRNYDIAFWDGDKRGEFFEAERLYDPQELNPHESWIAELFEPVRQSFFCNPPPPIMFFMPSQSLPKDASVAYLVGMSKAHHGAFKEIVLHRHRKMVEVFTVTSYGRRFYRTLDYTTNADFSLEALSPPAFPRQEPWALWERFAAGDPTDSNTFITSAVISRGPECPENLSNTVETHIPGRFIHGICPTALADAYMFWQDEKDNIRGYPIEESNTTVLFIELKRVTRTDGLVEPGVSARVTRMPRSLMQARQSNPKATLPPSASGSVEDEELELVNLLWAPKYSQLYQVASIFARLAGLSHTLAWKRVATEASLGKAREQVLHMDPNAVVADAARAEASSLKFAKTEAEERAEAEALAKRKTELVDLCLIELPLLKMSFCTRIDSDGECRIFSLDHADLYVSNARGPRIERILAGVPHGVIMSNAAGELSMLVPAIRVARPTIQTAPLSTELVLGRKDIGWLEKMETRYFLYPIHVSLSFVFTPTLASSLYLLLLRFLNRDYPEVFRLAEAISCDTELSDEENQIFLSLGIANDDVSADACSCRLKITLAMMDSTSMTIPWRLLPVYGLYSERIETLSASCRLAHHDEVRVARAALPVDMCGHIRRFERASRSRMTPMWLPTAIAAYNRLQYVEALVYNRRVCRSLTMPPPAVHSIFTADIGTVEELLAAHGHEDALPEEVRAAVRPSVQRHFKRPVRQVYRPARAIAGAVLFQLLSRYLNRSEGVSSMAAGGLGFLFSYQLLQRDSRVRVHGRDCAQGLGVFTTAMLPTSQHDKLLVILKLMIQRPDIAKVLPRWSDFSKVNPADHDMSGTQKPVPVEGLNEFVTEIINVIAKLYRANPIVASPRFGAKIATVKDELAYGVLPNPARTVLLRDTAMRSWVMPQLSDYDCDLRYLVAAPSNATHGDAGGDSQIERRAALRSLAGEGAKTPAAALKNALREWERIGKTGAQHINESQLADLHTLSARGSKPLVSGILSELAIADAVTSRALAASGDIVSPELPIDVQMHPDAQSGVARAMDSRLKADMKLFSEAHNAASDMYVRALTDEDVRTLLNDQVEGAAASLASVKAKVSDLITELLSLKKDDESAVSAAFSIAMNISNARLSIPKSGDAFAQRLFGRDAGVVQAISQLDSTASLSLERRLQHYLSIMGGREMFLELEYVIGALLSSRAVFDLRKVNPFLTDESIRVIFAFIEAALLRANRIGHINRTVSEARDLIKLLSQAEKYVDDPTSIPTGAAALIAGVIQKSKSLGTLLVSARHFFDEVDPAAVAEKEGSDVADARSAAEASMWSFGASIPEEQLCRVTPDAPSELERLARAHEAKVETWAKANNNAKSPEAAYCSVLEARTIRKLFGHGMRGESIPIFRGALEKLADEGVFGMSRAAKAGVLVPGSSATSVGEVVAAYDPRFLVFEFTWNIMLRKSQVAMVRDFAESIRSGRSIVKQMIMGAGKTTVVAPLLTLMFGDGKSLVMEVVPPALLEFSRSIMRSTFSTVMYKRVLTFHFDRASIPNPSMLTKLRAATSSRSIVIATPTSVKSVMLKLLETQQQLKDPTLPRSRELEHERDILVELLREFKSGVLLMDEVDMILHPLKSELNFPVGAKHDLDFDPLRWRLAMHVLDAIYFHDTPVVPSDFRDSKQAAALLQQISAKVTEGLANHHMQSSPHIVLLNTDYYYDTLLPLMCDWMMLWIEAQHLTGITAAQLREYLSAPGIHSDEIAAVVENNVTPHFRKMLNLARDWLRSYLPHVLQKIDRVSFGLLSPDDLARALKNDPNIPETRAKLAIPFLGKDVPSETSEFAHPDVIIGLTYMAYRYEGLRYTDFCEIVDSMHSSLAKELGPYAKRPTVQRYARWVHESAGRIRGESAPLTKPSAAASVEMKEDGADADEEEDSRPEVMPLRLLKKSNVDHMKALFALVEREPLVIQWYLNEFIYPAHLRHQKIKLSASGVEVGGDMLFSRRVGFSGTPSDLLPIELGKCDYEKGTDGMMMHVLTSPKIVGVSKVEEDWSVHSLLRRVATAAHPVSGQPMFQALIDTGALVTGLSNKGVAEYLLEHGLSWAEGVVFLDELDRKMVLVRATKRVVKLQQCGIPADKRFAFYDQVHTTGMDISHRLDARAAITLGKDMTFRDYAQGAYRMRGLSKGQTVHLLVTPEIDRLIQRQLAKAGCSVTRSQGDTPDAFLQSVVAWLVVNAMQSEQTQFNQLAIQNVANVWRKNAFKELLDNAVYFGLNAFPLDPKVDAEYKAKKARIALQARLALEKESNNEIVNKEKIKNERRAARRRVHKQRIEIRAEFLAKVRAAGGTHAAFRVEMSSYRDKIEAVLEAKRRDQYKRTLLGFEEVRPESKVIVAGAKLEPTVPRNDRLESALLVFEEDVNFTLEDVVPRPVPFNEALNARIVRNEHFLSSSDERAICEDAVQSVMRSAGNMLQLLALTAEMVQTVEEERERAIEQEQESEIEVEKFVDMSYTRDNESQVPWPLTRLKFAPDDEVSCEEQPFYSASLFSVPGARAMSLPPSLFISSNYYDRRWMGARRVKNAVMYLEYAPHDIEDTGAFCSVLNTSGPMSLATRMENGPELAGQLDTAFRLFDRDGSGDLNEDEAAHFISAVTTERIGPSRTRANLLMRALGVSALTKKDVERVLVEGTLVPAQRGRYFVCLSLREAESLRWWMHARVAQGKPGLFDDAAVDVVLRCSANDNMIIDVSTPPEKPIDLFAPLPEVKGDKLIAAITAPAEARSSMVHVVWQAMRYLNCETYFSTADLSTLLSVIDANDANQRLLTFSAVQACRRRARRKWHETPVARLFNVSNDSQLHSLKSRAMAHRIRSVLRERLFGPMDAFRAFDYNRNGMLSPDEVMGGITWLGIADMVTVSDVLDLIGFADRKDGNLQTKDFGDVLRDPSLADDKVGGDADGAAAGGADEDDLGGIDDADLPIVLPVRAEEVLAAWEARAIADLVGSTANAGSVSKDSDEGQDKEDAEGDAMEFIDNVVVRRDPGTRECYLEVDLTKGIPSFMKPVGDVEYVPGDAPGNLDRVGYVRCSHQGGFEVTIPMIGPFKKYPSARTMKAFNFNSEMRFLSAPKTKIERNLVSKAELKSRNIFSSALNDSNGWTAALFNNGIFPRCPELRVYDSLDPISLNQWIGVAIRQHPYGQRECAWGSFTSSTWTNGSTELTHSFRLFSAPTGCKTMGPNDPGHEVHIRRFSINSFANTSTSTAAAVEAFMKKSKWFCAVCSTITENPRECPICETPKEAALVAAKSRKVDREWMCQQCFHSNSRERQTCSRCHTKCSVELGDNEIESEEDAVGEDNVTGINANEDGLAGEGDALGVEGDGEGDAAEGDAAEPAADAEAGVEEDDEKKVDPNKAATSQIKSARHWAGSAVNSILSRLNIDRKLVEVAESGRFSYVEEEDDEEFLE